MEADHQVCVRQPANMPLTFADYFTVDWANPRARRAMPLQKGTKRSTSTANTTHNATPVPSLEAGIGEYSKKVIIFMSMSRITHMSRTGLLQRQWAVLHGERYRDPMLVYQPNATHHGCKDHVDLLQSPGISQTARTSGIASFENRFLSASLFRETSI